MRGLISYLNVAGLCAAAAVQPMVGRALARASPASCPPALGILRLLIGLCGVGISCPQATLASIGLAVALHGLAV